MREKANPFMLNNSTIEEVKYNITVCNPEGDAYEVTLFSPEDLLNETVPAGEIINLVYSNGEIYTGIYEYIEDEDGQIVIYLRHVDAQDHRYCLPFVSLVGYYKSNRK